MAIKKGIEPGACLWKRVDKRRGHFYNSRTGRHEERDMEYYYVYRLQTRRARTQGELIGQHLVPFFNAIGIRLFKWNPDAPMHTAVGVRIEHIVRKDVFDSIEVDATAQKYYDRMCNKDASLILEIPKKEEDPRAIIEVLMTDVDDDASEVGEWPNEPRLNTFRGYDRVWA